jgi:hypothetical protein
VADPLAAIFANNAALRRHSDQFAFMLAPQTDGRQLEFYPPWERDNPQPGKATVQLFNQRESPEVTQNLITGDMLHYLGAIDPRSGQPIDPTFFKLKQKLLASRTDEQKRIDDRAYQRDLPQYKNPPSKEDWMQFNRGDAYIRGKLTPDAQDNWRDMYTPQQSQLLDLMQQYLRRGSIAPGMNR